MERGDERTETHVTGSTHLPNRTGSVTGTAPTGVPSPRRGARLRHVRRSIDYHALEPDDLPLLDDGEDDERATPIAWNVAVSDDYVDAEPRVVLTIEEIGRAGYGLVAHLPPAMARRLRDALRRALREIGEDPGA